MGTRGCCLHLYTRRSHPLNRVEEFSIPSNNAGSSEFGTAGYDISGVVGSDDPRVVTTSWSKSEYSRVRVVGTREIFRVRKT
jgi:hypothetical protein